MGQCPWNDQQFLYIEERINDRYDMAGKIVSHSGILHQDVMCLFKGDFPARQCEHGQQKGGIMLALYVQFIQTWKVV